MLANGCQSPREKISDLFAKGSNTEAINELIALGKQRDGDSEYALGRIYLHGKYGEQKSLDKAEFWLKRAVDDKIIPALYWLGLVYGTQGKEKEAIPLFIEGARWGEADAIDILREKNIPVPPPDLIQGLLEKTRSEVKAENDMYRMLQGIQGPARNTSYTKSYGYAKSYQAIGNTVYGSDGTSYQRIGNTTYGSDGTTYQQIGNTTYGNDGYTSQQIGNTSYGNDGSTTQRIGNTYFNSNGTTCTRIGNTIDCN